MLEPVWLNLKCIRIDLYFPKPVCTTQLNVLRIDTGPSNLPTWSMNQKRFEHGKCRQAFHYNFKFALFRNFKLRFTPIPAKADFVQVTRQVLFAQIMEHTLFCTFKHCVKRLGGIVVGITTRISFALMVYPLMRCIFFTDQFIGMQLVDFKMRPFINKLIYHWRQIGDTIAFNRRRPHQAIMFNGNEYSLFGGAFATFVHNAFLIPLGLKSVHRIQFRSLENLR